VNSDTLVLLEQPGGRTQWSFDHAGRSYAVFTVGGELHVTDGACPHHGGPLAEGLVRDGFVTCPWHWYSYELATGRCRTAVGYELRRYPVVLVGGRPHVSLPAAAFVGSIHGSILSHVLSLAVRMRVNGRHRAELVQPGL